MSALLLVPRDHIIGHPATEGEYEALARRRARAQGRDLVPDPRTLEAYVSNGVWLADCPHCNNGIAIHPEWTSAPCLGLGCYRLYASITVPVNWRDIEAVLDVRPRTHQAWLSSEIRTKVHGGRLAYPAERLEDLIAENLAHRLPERSRRAG